MGSPIEVDHGRQSQRSKWWITRISNKTLKYSPTFPKRFASLSHARQFCDEFFTHYNVAHHHSGIALHTPNDVHYGLTPAIRARRQTVLDAAYSDHPDRFRNPPCAPRLPVAAWINRPEEETTDHATL